MRREFLTGFTGSTGEAVVTVDKAVLWTDGRYHIQADHQLDCNWILMKEGQNDVSNLILVQINAGHNVQTKIFLYYLRLYCIFCKRRFTHSTSIRG